MNLEQEYIKLIEKLDEILSLGKDGLLKSERMYQTIYEIEDKLKEISKSLDERSRLSIEKTIPIWRNVPKSGIFVNNEEVVKRVVPLRALLSELLSKKTGQSIINIKSEMVISADRQYEGRLYLRNILHQASTSIFIRDSYFRPAILDVLLEYLLDNNELKVEILMGENNRLSPFRASYQSFKNQYSTFNIGARYTARQNKDHPRYIFIDEQLLFNPDNSLDRWGEETVNIHQLTDKTEVEKVKNQLLIEWNTAINV
jgi:hypothetical protein